MNGLEWESLTAGSIVCNNACKNHRVVLSFCKQTQTIRLPSTKDRAKQGYVTYCRGDKYMFKLVKMKIVNCKKTNG